MTIQVLAGTDAELPSWTELVQRVRENFPGLETPQALAEHMQTVRRFMREQRALCVKDGERVVGVLLFSATHHMICCLAVLPEYRRKGIASALLAEALARLDRSQPITVSTFRAEDARGQAPRALYQHWGFVPGELVWEYGYPCQVFTLPERI